MSMKWSPPNEVAKWLVNGTAGVEMSHCPAMEAVVEYVERDPLHWILVLASSERGSGKSQAAEWLRARLLELDEAQDRRVLAIRRRARSGLWLWCECASLPALDALKPWEKAQAWERMRTCWLLILDDLGLEPDLEDMKALLQSRQGDGLITIATTNLVDAKGEHAGSHKHFVDRYGGRLSSRLRRMGDVDSGELSAWCHVPHRDMRGRVEPKLLPVAREQAVVAVGDEIGGLIAQLMESTDPKRVAEEQIAETYDRRRVEDAIREANRRKVVAGLLLEEVEALAGEGDLTAQALLSRARTRAEQGSFAGEVEAARAAGGGT